MCKWPEAKQRRRKRLLGAWVFTLPVLLAAAASSSIATRPISRLDIAWWKYRFELKQVELKRDHIALLWLGDSITQDWEREAIAMLSTLAFAATAPVI